VGQLSRRFVAHVAKSGLLPRGTEVIVACSGGSDSVALLRLLVQTSRQLRLGPLRVAHLDHALRDGSAEDARFVAALAAELGLPSDVERRPVRVRRGESPEAAARRVRYGFLRDVAEAHPGAVVATAHQADDQAETVLYRVVRGAGIAGLRGILPTLVLPRSAVRVVRPLLPFRRNDLRSWLADSAFAWREDPTNVDLNDRALLRNAVIPFLYGQLGRDPVPPLARLATIAQKSPEPPRPRAPRLPRPRPAGREPLPKILRRGAALGTAVFLQRLKAAPGTMELLAAEGVRPPFRVRRPRPGDRFHALGMPGPQRLSHYLQRRCVPAAERAAVALLCDADGIVWVVGHGIAARAALQTTTRRTWVVRRVEKGSEKKAARAATSRSRRR
jgi:tRNA(Ile)-lysidine synthase